MIPCFTGFKKPFAQDESKWHITQIYSALVEDEYRNLQIVDNILDAIKSGRTPIILTQRTEHVTKLADLLKNQTDATIITLIGADSSKAKNETMASLASVSSDKPLIIIATGKYVGEGFDYPRLDTLFLATPIAWKGTLAQYAGRLHREYPGKKEVIVYDYVDIHIPVLERMYHKRLTGYAQIGYKTISAQNQQDKINVIYDATSFVPILMNDFAEARKEILIVSPFMRKKRLTTILEWLKMPLENGIKVSIITRPAESYKASDRIMNCFELLHQPAIQVIQKPNIHQKFVIIDERIVWYGSINLLSFGSSEESIMRLDAREIAVELAEIAGKEDIPMI
jgi:hypothetical protein